ncbi:Ubiquitin-specific protease family C19-related protein isoform 1 [Theobroma cacao]|uniref:Ubiquitin-specific protease family C19-related protein isoform 1 n=1 Tax=Theobroma cacao TaxID=3641 RepID=A0A061GG60_THECC|nr:Ubiquitin-specific protease family C19-related protein isoform 1 [Theobroma cacao]
MGSRIQSHQLSSGLVVSGRPEQLKERQPTMSLRAVPYTGGDVKKSGELGKMFDIPVLDQSSSNGPSSNPNSKQQQQLVQPSRTSSSSQPNSGSVRSGSNSGPIRKSSGPMPLQPTGLITSGPLSSGPRRSGQLGQAEQAVASSGKAGYGPGVTSLGEGMRFGFRVSKAVIWVVMVVVVMGLLVGAFLMVAVKKVVVLGAVGAVVAPLGLGLLWNCIWGRKGLVGYVRRYPDAELRGAVDGQYVKVTGALVPIAERKSLDGVEYMFSAGNNLNIGGVVTCGSIPLESSYQRVPRCVYVSTELYEYKGWGGKSANPKHHCFSWGCRHSEKYVADFYISDFQSGLRALVKAGYGAKVAPFVKPATVADITKQNRDLSPSFLRWLAERNLSSDDRIMRLKEGYIKEGSTVSVMGVVRRHDNVLMIVPPSEPISTGCQWSRCLLPTYVEGLILTCDDNQNDDVVPV